MQQFAVVITESDQAVKSKEKGQGTENPIIAQLRSELTTEEIKIKATQPIKETISAGKSLFSLGQWFSDRLGSLIESQ